MSVTVRLRELKSLLWHGLSLQFVLVFLGDSSLNDLFRVRTYKNAQPFGDSALGPVGYDLATTR